MMWRGAGFEAVDLGVNVRPERFVEATREHGADVVGISALLTTMTETPAVVAAFRDAGMGDVPVVVGGVPVDQEDAEEIGASGYAKDAATAVIVVRRLLAAAGRAAPAQS